ncbi:hypothetical protein Hypma_001630 [Hypsizygus marmoreus]|uniref:Uncharacterized protein n=1 Tax=Hypsizygus marmoreus TaxID=39966 RepID=A0A369J5U6_HYPMA|nr:hypothetical protein Hypma_001630 [Hypsizygus marmoreus]
MSHAQVWRQDFRTPAIKLSVLPLHSHLDCWDSKPPHAAPLGIPANSNKTGRPFYPSLGVSLHRVIPQHAERSAQIWAYFNRRVLQHDSLRRVDRPDVRILSNVQEVWSACFSNAA